LKKRVAIWEKVQTIFYAEAPASGSANYFRLDARRKDVQGYEPGPYMHFWNVLAGAEVVMRELVERLDALCDARALPRELVSQRRSRRRARDRLGDVPVPSRARARSRS